MPVKYVQTCGKVSFVEVGYIRFVPRYAETYNAINLIVIDVVTHYTGLTIEVHNINLVTCYTFFPPKRSAEL